MITINQLPQAISKNTQESYSHSYRGIAHKGKRYTTQVCYNVNRTGMGT